jgi:hypothetical protein
MRLSLEERIPILEQLADDPNVAPRDRIKALEVLARFGVGLASEVETTHRFDTPPMTPEAAARAMELRLAQYRRLNEPNPLSSPSLMTATAHVINAEDVEIASSSDESVCAPFAIESHQRTQSPGTLAGA